VKFEISRRGDVHMSFREFIASVATHQPLSPEKVRSGNNNNNRNIMQMKFCGLDLA
jgi:hypothetical protein